MFKISYWINWIEKINFKKNIITSTLFVGVFLFAMFGVNVGQASATTYSVCSSGCAFTTITNAQNASITGDTINVKSNYNATSTDFAGNFELSRNLNCDSNVNLSVVSSTQLQLQIAFGVSGLSINNCTFGNIAINASGASSNINISDNIFTGSSTIYLKEMVGQVVTSPIISGNSGLNGLFLENVSSGLVTNNTFHLIDGVFTSFNSGTSLSLVNSNNVTISGNDFELSYSNSSINLSAFTANISNIEISSNTFHLTNSVTFSGMANFIGGHGNNYSVQNININHNYFNFSNSSNAFVAINYFPQSSLLTHNTFYGISASPDGSGDSYPVVFLNANGFGVFVTSTYNLFYNTSSSNSNADGFHLKNTSGEIVHLYSDHDGFYNYENNSQAGDGQANPNSKYGIKIDPSDVGTEHLTLSEGGNSLYGVDPILRLFNVDSTDDLYPTPFSTYFSSNISSSIGAYSAVRRTTIHVAQSGVIDYSTKDIINSQLGGNVDFLKSGDTLEFAAGTFDPIVINTTTLATSSITVSGAGATTIFNNTGSGSGITLNGFENSTIKDLLVQNASSSELLYTLTNSMFVHGGQTYNKSSNFGKGLPDGYSAVYSSPVCNPGNWQWLNSNANVTSIVNATTTSWNLALVIGSTVWVPDGYITSSAAFGAACDNNFPDVWVNNAFTYSNGEFTYNSAAIIAAGLSVSSTISTNPPSLSFTTTNVAGVKLINSNNNTVENVISTANKYGIWFEGSSTENVASGTVFSSNLLYDVYSSSDALTRNYLLNSTFNTASSSVVGNSEVDIAYTGRAYVTNNGAPVGGVGVDFVPLNSLPSFTVHTTSSGDGFTPYNPMISWVMTSSSPNNPNVGGFNPYTVTANAYAGLSASSTTDNLSSMNKTFYIAMEGSSDLGGWNGNLPVVNTDSKTKLLLVNGVYNLGFTSSTADGSYHLFFTTSTNGSAGSWSQPNDVFGVGIYPSVGNGKPDYGLFDLQYNNIGGYFGAVIYATGTDKIWFASSTYGVSGTWATSTAAGGLSLNDSRRRPSLDFSKTSNFIALFYDTNGQAIMIATSSNNGKSGSWSDSQTINLDGEFIRGKVTGSAGSHVFHFGYYNTVSTSPGAYNIVYATSSDAVSWATSTAATHVVYGPMELYYAQMVGFDLDSNYTPAFTYYLPSEITNPGQDQPFDTTSSLMYSVSNGLGGWTTSTIASDVHWQITSIAQRATDLFFYGTTPIIVGAGNEFGLGYGFNTSTWVIGGLDNSLSQTTNVSGVYNNSSHKMAVAYVQANGTLKVSDTSMNLSVGGSPATPVGLTITENTTSSVLLSWTQGNGGNEDAFAFEIYSNGGDTLLGGNTVSLSQTSTTIDHLPNTNHHYVAKVYSILTGVSTSTAALSSFYTSSSAPINLVFSNVSTSSMTLTWGTNNNPSSTVYHISVGSASTTVTTNTLNVDSSVLSPNTSYTFNVKAQNAGNTSTYSNVISGTTTTLSVVGSSPVIPSNLLVSDITTSSALINWTKGVGGSENIFFLEFSLNGVDYGFSATTSISASSFPLNGISPNKRIFVRLSSAVEGVSTSSPLTTSFYTSSTVPTLPVVSNVADTSLTLSWNANENTDTTNYRVTGNNGFSPIIIVAATTTNLSGLLPNTSYVFNVQAQNAGNTSTYSGSIASDTTITLASLPSVETFVASSISTSTVAFNGNLTSLGGVSTLARGFIYGISESYGTTSTSNGSFSIGTFSTSIDLLTPATPYHYKAFVTNEVGTSYGSDVTFVTVSAPTAIAPTTTITSANTATTTVTVSSDVSNSVLDFSALTSGNVATLPGPISSDLSTTLGTIQFSMSSGTVVTAGGSWDGVFTLPTVQANSSVGNVSDSGYTATVSGVVEIGYGDVALYLSKAARILIPNMAGKLAGYYRGSTFTKISSTCADDTQTTNDLMSANADCKITSGSDLVIWTRHFTKFAVYSQTQNQIISSSSGGSAPAPAAPVAPIVVAPTILEQTFSVNGSVEVKIGNTIHRVKVNKIDLTKNQATFTIESTPITFTLKINEEKVLDTNEDKINDIRVKLSSINSENKTVNLVIISIADLQFAINNFDLTTISRDVILHFNSPEAKTMAISESADFPGSSFETYSKTKKWKLSAGAGYKKLYVKFRTAQGGVKVISSEIKLLESTTSSEKTTAEVASPVLATPTNFTFKKNLSSGSISNDVKQLQIILKQLGYYTYPKLTNTFGPYTVEAVKKFQKANAISPVNGMVGAKTREVLNALNNPTVDAVPEASLVSTPDTNNKFIFKKNLSAGMFSDDVKLLQVALKELGYFTYPDFTTKFGAATREAVKAFQKANNITPANGSFGPKTREVLNSLR